MRRVPRALAFFLVVACEPPPTVQVTAPVAPASAQTPIAIDARLELEEGPDPSFGEGATSVRAVLVVAALQTHKQLFAVPFPYRCARRPGSDLAIECSGDDGSAFATLRADERHIVATARDYGRLDRNIETIELPLPVGVVVNIYAPAKLP